MPQKDKQFDIVLVIPFYNEEKYIGETLKCLKKQKVDSALTWAIVFVDNKSTDSTKEIVKKFCNQEKIIYSVISESHRGTVYSRTMGLIKASKLSRNLIISTDADTTFPVWFIESTYEDFIKTKGDVLVGRRRKKPEVELWKRFVSRDVFNCRRNLWNLEYSVFGPYFFGAYFAVRTQFFKKIPLFKPEKHEKFLGEDILLSRRSYYIGGKFIHSASVVTPNERRIITSQENSLGVFVGNKTRTHSQLHSVSELSFKKLSPRKEVVIKQRLINFEARRFIWMICDAYLFWVKTNKQYNNAYRAAKKGMNFFGLPFTALPINSKRSNQKKLFLLLEKKYLKQVAVKIEMYINARQ